MKVPPPTMGPKRIRLEEESSLQEQPLGLGPDLISRLPDEVLGDIISLLSTREGARTQGISRRWRPLWRAAPLNLDVNQVYGLSRRKSKCIVWVTKILSEHTSPGRCFKLSGFCLHDRYAMVDGWLQSQALTGLRKIHFGGYWQSQQPQPMPPSALRFAPTLCSARFALCDFPSEMPPALNFPHLKKLSLIRVTVSEDALRILLSGCSVLEILLLRHTVGFGRLRISSPTLRSIGFTAPPAESSVAIKFQELVVEDAPCLERLLPLDPEEVPATIRVMQAPKLQIVGLLSPGISRLEFGKTVFLEMMALSLTTSMRTVKILALESLGPNLDSVVDFLKCFPCVEKLYLTCNLQKTMKNERAYNPLDPIECLEVHLKKVVVNNYRGIRTEVDFAKFFVLNAKVLKEMDFGALVSCNDKWMASQHRRLQLDKRASPGARFAFERAYRGISIPSFHMADPFEWLCQTLDRELIKAAFG